MLLECPCPTSLEAPMRMPHQEPKPVRIRHYPQDHSVFMDDEYVIRGVAGSVLWRMLDLYRTEGRTEFTNRELRLDPHIRLPEVVDNLESRLNLLMRRLNERFAAIQLEKRGRGRLALRVDRPVDLQSVGQPGHGVTALSN